MPHTRMLSGVLKGPSATMTSGGSDAERHEQRLLQQPLPHEAPGRLSGGPTAAECPAAEALPHPAEQTSDSTEEMGPLSRGALSLGMVLILPRMTH